MQSLTDSMRLASLSLERMLLLPIMGVIMLSLPTVRLMIDDMILESLNLLRVHLI